MTKLRQALADVLNATAPHGNTVTPVTIGAEISE